MKRALKFLLLGTLVPCASEAQTQAFGAEEATMRRPARTPAALQGTVTYYRSKIDGQERPYTMCATDSSSTPKPLIICVSPSGDRLEDAIYRTGLVASIIKENGQAGVVLRPTGRGPGTLYMNYGEVDLFEALEDVLSKHAIDRDRISIYGHSMGGAATWYLASHYPDIFAAAAPMSGYSDYRLWRKPGGYTFHLQEWDEPSWIARSAVFLVENLVHTPVWILHGEWDRGTGSGVSVEHARQMKRLMTNHGFAPKYLEVAGKAHHFTRDTEPLFEEMILWLLAQRKVRLPEHVSLVTYDLRHNRSYWVTIDQLQVYGAARAQIDARKAGGRMVVTTDHVRMFSLGPVAEFGQTGISIDGQELGQWDLGTAVQFRKDEAGRWRSGEFKLENEKRRGSAGGVGDLFFENVILVPGTVGTDEETHFAATATSDVWNNYRKRNGGVHRGGIMGENAVDLTRVPDHALTDEQLQQSNLILFGTYKTNAVLARLRDSVPLAFERDGIRVYDRHFMGEKAAVFAVFPHPLNPARYIAVHGGLTPDATCWGSHLDVGLLPDFLAYSEHNVLGWGFQGNDWKSQR